MIDRKQVLWGITEDEDKLFLSRMCDLLQRSEDIYKILYTKFLNPRQQLLIKDRLHGDIRFFGGYEGAERLVAAFVPSEWEEPEFPIAAVKISPTNKRVYSHRDYHGSLLGLGITRELIGDIVVDGSSATVILMEDMADFVMMNLTGVASAKVRITEVKDMAYLASMRSFKESDVTVSSLRFDCVLSAVANKSRSETASLIASGMASVNYDVSKNPSLKINSGDIISLRGFGKALIETDGNLTKKGRIHIKIKKYV